MKHNQNVVLPGKKAILVPYRREHVEQYHKWMQDVTLQETMDTDPLTLQEEFEVQQRWVDDQDRCMFIILDPLLPEAGNTKGRGGGMAGEVILYLSEKEGDKVAQIEVTIADVRSRRKGVASEAVIMSMMYAMTVLERTVFIAKIGFKNTPSQQLFQKLGFKEHSKSTVFKELTYTMEIPEATKQKILEVIAITLPPYTSYDRLSEPSWHQSHRPSNSTLRAHHQRRHLSTSTEIPQRTSSFRFS